ncbi:MAG TPA: thioesterase family protein [Gemmatimonadales bacterium]|nr:thioesterase family protein [Gemmatimonadales bacterium]
MTTTPAPALVSSVELRVRYAETDQMGVAYHTHYLVWCEVARTEHMRRLGVRYRDIEEGKGIFLAVVEAHVRYRAAARYDDVLLVRCWLRDVASRQVTFGYAMDRPADGRSIALAQTTLVALNRSRTPTTIPESVIRHMLTTADPVRMPF